MAPATGAYEQGINAPTDFDSNNVDMRPVASCSAAERSLVELSGDGMPACRPIPPATIITINNIIAYPASIHTQIMFTRYTTTYVMVPYQEPGCQRIILDVEHLARHHTNTTTTLALLLLRQQEGFRNSRLPGTSEHIFENGGS